MAGQKKTQGFKWYWLLDFAPFFSILYPLHLALIHTLGLFWRGRVLFFAAFAPFVLVVYVMQFRVRKRIDAHAVPAPLYFTLFWMIVFVVEVLLRDLVLDTSTYIWGSVK